ncbi:alpha/beta fold hydrolase [Microbulbifer sp. ZKSA006]|uniref:alpha/beta fold hydrolase n=1 Tax=Microbulbifer sp. ZKSA006 TaxID=3243390 RepID=UPI00403A311B
MKKSTVNFGSIVSENSVKHRTESVDGINIFYRESGDPSYPTIVLLHGFPSSSYQYREVLSRLGNEFHIIAPDYPGFGYSDKPSIEEYEYTFDNLASTISKFLDQQGIKKYFLMIHDYGAPVGFRIATSKPDQVTGFIVMNGNAYKEGLSELTLQSLSSKRSFEDEQAKVNGFMSLEGIQWMYTSGANNPENISPDGWHLDHAVVDEFDTSALNLELLYDYPNNLKHYVDWQSYLREMQPPMLIVWGGNDPIFPGSGAEAYKKDVKVIDFHLYDTGHFPLEEYADDIVQKMRVFLRKQTSVAE